MDVDRAAQPRARPHGRPGEPSAPRARAPLVRSVIWVEDGRAVKGPADDDARARAASPTSSARRERRMSTLVEILSPNFLLRDALVGSVLVGLVCPLVGVYFVLRRMIFLGVALPQLSAAGIAFSFLVYRHRRRRARARRGRASARSPWSARSASRSPASSSWPRSSAAAARPSRRGSASTYAIAAAATILFLAADPYGEAQMVNLLKGDILATTGTSLARARRRSSARSSLVLFAFRKEFLLVSFDRDLAVVFGKRAGLWDALLYLADRRHDLARRDDGGPDGHLRLPGRAAAHGAARRRGAC